LARGKACTEGAKDGDAPAGLSPIGACRGSAGRAAGVGDPGPRGGWPAACSTCLSSR